MDSDLIDMIAKDDSASDVHDKIKDLLYAKSAENIDGIKPTVTGSLFGGPQWGQEEPQTEGETEVDATEPEASVDAEAPEVVETEPEVETPTAEVETPDNETEEEKPEA